MKFKIDPSEITGENKALYSKLPDIFFFMGGYTEFEHLFLHGLRYILCIAILLLLPFVVQWFSTFIGEDIAKTFLGFLGTRTYAFLLDSEVFLLGMAAYSYWRTRTCLHHVAEIDPSFMQELAKRVMDSDKKNDALTKEG